MALPSVLIGHTGFAGRNLWDAHPFDRGFNSANIGEARGLHAGLLICAGMRGTKWIANRDPMEDARSMDVLVGTLRTMKAEEAILISTTDVYVDTRGRTELDPPEETGNHPYGAHRARMEILFREMFPSSRIVRLPGVYGPYLKKNALWDLLTGHELAKVNSAGIHQYYNLRRLWSEVQHMRASGLHTLNIATAPTAVHEVAAEVFGVIFHNPLPQPADYDMRTLHAAHWGGHDGYLMDRAAVIADLRAFVHGHPARKPLALPRVA